MHFVWLCRRLSMGCCTRLGHYPRSDNSEHGRRKSRAYRAPRQCAKPTIHRMPSTRPIPIHLCRSFDIGVGHDHRDILYATTDLASDFSGRAFSAPWSDGEIVVKVDHTQGTSPFQQSWHGSCFLVGQSVSVYQAVNNEDTILSPQ